jgi:cytochrome c
MHRKQLLLAAIMATLSVGAHADKMTAMKSGCMGCHQPDRATVGPSIQDIAAKYGSDADVDALVAVVKKGKAANELTWGKIPMPASPAPESDVRTVIGWMLTQQ